MTWRAMSARPYPQVTGITGIKITMVRFALEQYYDFLRISQGGVNIPQLSGVRLSGVSSRYFTDLPAQLQVPFTLGPGDVTVDFTSDGRGLHSSTLQLNFGRCFH